MLSVITPCFNAEKYISACLESILSSNFQGFEVIIVDDGSTDNSRQILQGYQNHPPIKVFYLEQNQGPAKARNIGAKNANGKYLFFLDVDTKIEKECLKVIVEKLEQNENIGAIQGNLILNTLNDLSYLSDLTTETAGHFLTFFGFPYEVKADNTLGNNPPFNASFCEERVIFGARSAALAIRKELFEKIGGFDEDYFIYGEDTDLSWRVWLAGFKVHFLPQAKVYHFGKSSLNKETNYRVFYEGAKNNTQNILKNASLGMILWMLPLHVLAWMLLSFKLSAEGRFRQAFWVYRGFLNNLSHLSDLIAKRKTVARFKDPHPDLPKIIYGPLRPKELFLKGVRWLQNV
ncbi:MAG: glycosyltransferase [Candidatus Cloacimonetes bacterium]|nr:glycosyltransferase [Candidatus Cloacimonadota bacterium]